MSYNDDRDFRRQVSVPMTGVVPLREQTPSNFLHPRDDEFVDPEDSGFDFWAVVQILLSRKWLILAITLCGLLVGAMTAIRSVPMYKSAATIEIQREETQILEGASVDPVVVADAEYMATQYELLRSRTLAERVADLLDLPSDPLYADQTLTRVERLDRATSTILDGLRVTPEGRSRVVRVEFISSSPTETARIANAIVENFIQSALERKYNTTAYAREFLQERLAVTKVALEKSERELVAYAERQGILDLNTGDTGGVNLDTQSLIALNADLADAESERIEKEQRFLQARDNPASSQSLESSDLQRLRASRSDLVAEYQELLGKFKPEYPDMVRLQARIDAIDEELREESKAIVIALEGEYNAALARERSLQDRVSQLKNDVQSERNRRIDYTILKREVDTNRSQYEALLNRLKEVSIASGVGSSQVSIVDRAVVPTFPFEPNLPRTLLQFFIVSFGLGIGAAFALNYVDDTIKTPEDIRKKLGLPAIGIIPKIAGKNELVIDSLDDPKSGISEAFVSARTALEFTTDGGAPKSLLVTSTRPSEGKTSTTISMARAFARIGRSVLIIDADMRKPSFVVENKSSIGLSGLLTSDASLRDHAIRSDTPGLWLLPSGVIPPNPAELLSGPRLRQVVRDAEDAFDIVIVDSPPVLSFADAPLLGASCSGALIVIQAGAIRRPAVERTLGRLYESRTNVLGVVLMKFDAKTAGYDYGYYYSAYGAAAYNYVELDGKAEEKARRRIRLQAADAENDADKQRRA
ncbi:MAG: polysaccharide biosynthesis tyrosine autokinase [Pseudomonadota bacterium]